MDNEMKIFAGNSNPALASEIAEAMNVGLGRAEVGKFPEGECKVKIHDNIRGADVFIIQSTCPPVNDNLVELLVMIDACRRASARRITAVIPYFGYARQDRKDQPRVPITAKLVANLITEAGADRVLTMDLHAQQIQGFFDIPLDHLMALPVLIEHFKALKIENLSICTADVGGIKGAWKFAERLSVPLAIVDKKRSGDDKVEALALIGDVKGKNIIIPDDMIATGGTLVNAAKFLRENGAKDLYAACTHGVLSGNAVEKLKGANFKEVIMTNTIPLAAETKQANYKQLSIAKLFGEAILRIHKETSVSSLFE
ncbi:MAG TPA: ribose-phosphate pyrophosphokinase [bacterium]|nr:ribose-phosphate pyrophosphokinase [bacterium]